MFLTVGKVMGAEFISVIDPDTGDRGLLTWGGRRDLTEQVPKIPRGAYWDERGYFVIYGKKKTDPYLENRERCFAAGTAIRMADGTTKPVEQVNVGDLVMAFDATADLGRGALVPKRVTRTFVTPDQPLIDLNGLRVTPGHEFLCGDGQFRTIKEVLDTDGTIVNESGQVIRARTGLPAGSREDQIIPIGFRAADGAIRLAYMRAGTPYARRADDGRIVSIAARMAAEGFHLRADGRFENIEGDVVTAFWEWGAPDERFLAAPDKKPESSWLAATDPIHERAWPSRDASAPRSTATSNRRERRATAALTRKAARMN